MSSFKEFMDEVGKLPGVLLPGSNLSISAIQAGLLTSVGGILSPFSISTDKKQKFSEELSRLIQDETFISELSSHIGEPSDTESEDEFVERSSNILRKMLYKKFGVRD